jgi:1-acyl-sn-glycerol-3-phosphate acyltransferase
MIYFLLKVPIRTSFKTHFRKVFICNEQLIPRDHSIILGVNHPTAFLDPIAYAAFSQDFVFHFALRGDVFTTPLVRFLLKEVHCIPIYRFRDGFQALRKNAKSFKQIYGILEKGKRHMSVMAEGVTQHRKKLKPIQKGVATMAFGAWKKTGKENIAIVPHCLNYTNSHEFRSYVTFDFGEPIYLRDYFELYEEDDRKAIEEVTEELEERMRKLTVHIEQDEDEPPVNALLDMARNNRRDPAFPIVSTDRNMHVHEMRIADMVNAMVQEEKEELFEILGNYQAALSSEGLKDIGLAQPNRYNFFNSVLLFLGAIPALLAYGLSYPPFRLCYDLASRMVKKIEFHASIRIGLAMFVVPLWHIILFVLALIFGAGWWSFLVFLLPFLGYGSLLYFELLEKWNAARKVARKDKEVVNRLTLQREDLLGRVEDIV